jgi:glycosyltransferase involved in cell wall biosynthesis
VLVGYEAKRFGIYEWGDSLLKVGVVIPVLNESKSLSRLFEEVCRATSVIDDVYFRVVFIDDGSSDSTWGEIGMIAELASEKEFFPGEVKGVRHPRNLGKTAAQMSGIGECSDCDFIIFMDGDGQHNPEYIGRLLEKSKDLREPVSGRRVAYNRGVFSSIGASLLSMTMSVFGVRFERSLSEFLVIPSSFAKVMVASPFYGAAPLLSLVRAISKSTASVDVVIREPIAPRKSSFKMSTLWDKGISELLTNPSQILPRVSLLFISVTFFAGFYGLYVGVSAVVRGEPSGIGSVIVVQSLMFFISTALGLFIFGVIALLIRAKVMQESIPTSSLKSTLNKRGE